MDNKKIIIIGIILAILIILGVYYIFQPQQVTNYPSKGIDIIAYGDSLVEGVGSTSGNDFVSLLSKKIGQPIINLGNSGDTTEDGIKRIKQLDNYHPKVVLLLLCGNDELKKISVLETHKNLAILIQNIQARGSIVLLLGVRGGIFIDTFGKEFISLKNTYHTAYVSDVLGGLFGKSSYMSDAVHPNDAGYRIIADRVFPVLNGLLK